MEQVLKRAASDGDDERLIESIDRLIDCVTQLREELVSSRPQKKPALAAVHVILNMAEPEPVVVYGRTAHEWKPLVLHRIVDAKTGQRYWMQAQLCQPVYKPFVFHADVMALSRKNNAGALHGIDSAEIPIGCDALRHLYKMGIIKNPGQKLVLLAADDDARWSGLLKVAMPPCIHPCVPHLLDNHAHHMDIHPVRQYAGARAHPHEHHTDASAALHSGGSGECPCGDLDAGVHVAQLGSMLDECNRKVVRLYIVKRVRKRCHKLVTPGSIDRIGESINISTSVLHVRYNRGTFTVK